MQALASPRLRPDVFEGPEQRRRRSVIEAALFGGAPELLSVGRFRLLLDRLEEGGMGTVYAAFDERIDHHAARVRGIGGAALTQHRTLQRGRQPALGQQRPWPAR